jgi:NAD(P)-dependent dehydrogenase (short-subunit alcohol dehydrogenase family)
MIDFSLNRDGVAVVTGAAGAIGRACVEAFAASGATVALVDVEPQTERMERILTDVRSRHPHAEGSVHACDVADPAEVEQLAAQIAERWGRLDYLALVAGIIHDARPVEDVPIEDWDRVLGVNLRGPFLLARAFIPLMRRQQSGSIVAIGSWYGRLGHAFFGPYCASKAGLIVLTQVLAAELAPAGIRANTVSPGNVDTTMHHKALADEAVERGISYDEMRAIEWAKIPLGAPSRAEDIANAVLFLCSGASSSITGSSIDVNGGVLFR